jgi:ribosome-binding factor A
MTVPGRRTERLADRIRAEVAEMVLAELKDPRIGFATVTEVDVSGDLQHARVSVSVLGDANARQKSVEGLTSAASYVRHELAQRLNLRRVPEVTFVLDAAVEENERLEMLLEKLKKEP